MRFASTFHINQCITLHQFARFCMKMQAEWSAIGAQLERSKVDIGFVKKLNLFAYDSNHSPPGQAATLLTITDELGKPLSPKPAWTKAHRSSLPNPQNPTLDTCYGAFGRGKGWIEKISQCAVAVGLR